MGWKKERAQVLQFQGKVQHLQLRRGGSFSTLAHFSDLQNIVTHGMLMEMPCTLYFPPLKPQLCLQSAKPVGSPIHSCTSEFESMKIHDFKPAMN
jgi:hypothetical protein